MDGDNEYNRNRLDMENFCQKFWDKSVKAAAQVEKEKLDTEEKQREAEQKKHAEEQAEIAEVARKAAQAAVEKKLLAEAVEKNNNALKMATHWKFAKIKNQSTYQDVTAVTNTSSSTATTKKNATSLDDVLIDRLAHVANVLKKEKADASVSTATNGTVETSTHNMTKMESVTILPLHAAIQKDDTPTNAVAQSNQTIQKSNQTVQNTQSIPADTANNKTQVLSKNMSNTLKAMIKNTTAALANQKQIQQQIQSNLTKRVKKQLRFVMNHTKHTKNLTA